LTAEEERSLAEAVARGDSAARERLILANMNLAKKIAKEWKGHGLESDDLVSEAYCGLIRAVDKFDPSQGTRFSTYATIWIRSGIALAVARLGGLIPVSLHAYRLICKWKRTSRALANKLGHVPSPDEIAEQLGLGAIEARGVLATMNSKVVLASMLVGDSVWNTALESKLSAVEPAVERDRARKRELLRERMQALTRLEKQALKLRYGLDGRPAHSLRELSEKLRMSRFTARALALEAEQRLRRPEKFRPRGRRTPGPASDPLGPVPVDTPGLD
jgi:RNA polymerase primary sigma factor